MIMKLTEVRNKYIKVHQSVDSTKQSPNLQLAGLAINQDSAGGRVGAYVPPHRRDDTGSNSGRSDSGRRSKNSDYRQHDDYNSGGRSRGYVKLGTCFMIYSRMLLLEF